MSIHNWGFESPSDPASHFEQWGIRLAVRVGVHRYVADHSRTRGIAVPADVSCVAIVDSGCTRTAIDLGIAQELGLPKLGQTAVSTAAGPQMSPVYAFSIMIDNDLVLDCIQGVGCDLASQELGALIGMDLLSNCIMILNGQGGSFTIAK